MKSLFTLLAFGLSFGLFPQGLNYELGVNFNYDQSCMAVANVNNYSYFVNQKHQSNSFISITTLSKIDTLGNTIWSHDLQFTTEGYPNEYVIVDEILPSENDGVYIAGTRLMHCDVITHIRFFLQKYSASGALLWTKTWINQNYFGESLSGLTTDNVDGIYINYTNDTSSKIYKISYNGTFMDSININTNQVENIEISGNGDYLISKNQTLSKLSANGSLIEERIFNDPIRDFLFLNDTLFLLTTDSIFSVNNNLQIIAQNAVLGTSNYSHLKTWGNMLYFLSATTTAQKRICLRTNLQLVNILDIPVSTNLDDPKDFNQQHLSVGSNFEISNNNTVIRVLDHSLLSTTNATENWTDIGIDDIITQHTITQNASVPELYNLEIMAQVKLKNYGNQILNTCKINHFQSMHVACGDIYFIEQFNNLNLAPGDSMWIDLGIIYSNLNFYPGVSDTISREVCVYTSHPNDITDTIVNNDAFCRNLIFGYVGTDEIDNISNNRTLVKVVDILGREIEPIPNTVLIYVYSDGSTERVVHSE